MTAHRSTLRRMTMALAIAYLLVLQAVIGGIASGAHAAGLASGTMDPAICRGAQDVAPSPAGPVDSTHHTPECCFTGCQINAVGSVPPVSMAGIGVPAPRPAVRIEPTAALHHPAGLERSPQHARAPPLA
ncbi:hypothetical protein AncyloWKF20_09630 [Ancylobacter sp. WKF20]|uniref:hypothetical protein n=1 Tax=Ancylobacter sp. WKF20 TaxID=3039801 RepID=UPI0024340E96|nr:hypothetical protein [Ancylobacter sp. WKF20]WGD32053.1 hypothetical protein AncyloWKF20_09630 [Ancylobacter sp. WKF20]